MAKTAMLRRVFPPIEFIMHKTLILHATVAVWLTACATPAGSAAAGGPDSAGNGADTASETDSNSSSETAADSGATGSADASSVDGSKPDGGLTDAGASDAAADSGAADTGKADAIAPADAASACPAGAFKPSPAAACQEATCTNMAAAVQASLAAAQAKYEGGCTVDDNCVVAPTDTACAGSCGMAIVKTHAAALGQVIADLDASICKPLGYGAKCSFATPSCMEPSVGCASGKCVYSKPASSPCGQPQPANSVCEGTLWVCKAGFFKGYAANECVEATCANLAAAKNDAIQTAVAKAQACSNSEDCVHIATGTDCGGTCGVAVNAGMQNDVLKIVGWIDDNLCKKYEFKTKCGFSTPKCMAPKPTCGQGVCWYNATVP